MKSVVYGKYRRHWYRYKISSLKNSAKDFMTAVISDQSVVTVQKLKYYLTTET